MITYKSGDVASQIDYILMKGKTLRVTNCKVIPGEECVTQHRLLCADIKVVNLKRRQMNKREKKIKAWRLKDDNIQEEFQEKLNEKFVQTAEEWKESEIIFMNTAKEVCGETTGYIQRERETWWWNEEVKQRIVDKKIAFKKWQTHRTEENKLIFKETARLAKREVAKAKRAAWKECV